MIAPPLRTPRNSPGFILVILGLLLGPTLASAQEQQQGICAQIKMVISQQLALERVGFLATLTITDNDPTDPITDFAANLTFENPLLSTNGVANDASSLFFVQAPTLQGINSVAGDGVLNIGQTATISWFIVPTAGAGGTSPSGVSYSVSAALSGKLRGIALPAATLAVLPAPINVRPDAQFRITYFQPRDVLGDNPFTPQVESPIPFTFGVLVENVGYGTAHSVTINSQQPKIVDNKQNAPLIAQLLGSRVNDSALASANLTMNLGDLPPGGATKGAWDMIASISGTFLSVNASYTHSTDLGGSKTSLIKSLNAYLFLHEVQDDTPGRDNVRDFLADTNGVFDAFGNLVPDSLFESEGGVLPVVSTTAAEVTNSDSLLTISLAATQLGWTHVRVDDPQQAKRPIASVVRSDGKVLNPNNYWTNVHYEPTNNFEHFYLNIFDKADAGSYTYAVTYGIPPVSTNPPVTTLLFAGSSTLVSGVYYVTPATQMYFVSQDITPVTVFYSLDGGPFVPAYPFSLTSAGVHQIIYYATNSSGLQETNHTALVSLSGVGSLGFASFNVPSQPIFTSGDALSIRPSMLPITFQALANPLQVDAQIDIFQGAVGWATVAGTPSSPTAGTSASLVVAGQGVDFYSYSLNGQGWSADQPVNALLNLSGLPLGTNTVAVLGRSQFGSYLDPTNATAVSWVIDPAAPPTVLSGAPESPAQSGQAQLAVSGAGVTAYRWSIDNGYYRPETVIAVPLTLTNLTLGQHVVGVLGKTSGGYQASNNPTTLSWTVNPLYGYDQSALSLVRSMAFTNIGATPLVFNWDGRSNGGVIQPPGWYTVRVRLMDHLGETNFMVGWAQIAAWSATNFSLADASRGPKNPHARGRWAVWQDQSSGNWAIYARDLTVSGGAIIPVSTQTLSQENPKTDGRYVVWQARQPDGDWDIYCNDLTSSAGPQAITFTPDWDEVNPAIDWPWIVYQARPNTTNNASWQVYAYNLATAETLSVDPSTQDQVTPDVQAGRVVWQDWRDAGPGEIYFQNLESGDIRRLTTNPFGQNNPAIYDNWVVWQDNRNTESDIYGYDLLRNIEVRITNTPEDETQPRLNGPWLVCLENSLGAAAPNPRIIHLPSLAAVTVTHTTTLKSQPTLAEGQVIWLETIASQSSVVAAGLPAIQPVFADQNVVAVTDAMATYAQTAFGLLSLWSSNGVQSVTSYSELIPQVVSQTATLINGVPAATNFNLVAGSFLRIKFDSQKVLDLGMNHSSPLNLASGANVFGYSGFPDAYSAYQLLRQLGLNNARAVRMLDSQSGLWLVAEVLDGTLIGNDFPIPNVAVLMVDITNPVNAFTPHSP